jgi:hypothetical protein
MIPKWYNAKRNNVTSFYVGLVGYTEGTQAYIRREQAHSAFYVSVVFVDGCFLVLSQKEAKELFTLGSVAENQDAVNDLWDGATICALF